MIFSLITLMIRANLDFKGDIILIKVGIVGGTGYTGAELLRILVQHPNVELCVITSRTESGKRVDALFPNLRGACDLVFSAPSNGALSRCDLVFFATPHGTAQSMMKPLISAGVRVVDLSADFRLKDIALWERWYGQKHSCPDLVGEAVYGLPEVNRDHLPSAQLVACPGCYPTSVQLGLLPLLRAGWVDTETIIVNAASGISGAGKSANTSLLMAENYDSFRAYSVSGHRHLPEIEQGLAAIRHGGDPQLQGLNVTFVPHLLPIVRGIHSTIYVRTNDSAGDIQQLYESTYSDTIFVDVLPNGQYPETRTVKGTNLCRVGVENPQEKGMLVIMSVIDNLAKGASTQAVQNMNLMFGWDEDLAINFVAVLP